MKWERLPYYISISIGGILGKHVRTMALGFSVFVALLGIVASVLQIRGGTSVELFGVVKGVALEWSTYWFTYMFTDPRASLFWIAIAALGMVAIYQAGQKRLRQLLLDRKEELDSRLRTIKPPDGHYLALIIGKLGEKARQLQDDRARDIISAINKNIKKEEEVYWISISELGILMYEAKDKSPEYFLNVIFHVKLPIQLGSEKFAREFADDITFAIVKAEAGAKIEDLEFAARKELERAPFFLRDIETPKVVPGNTPRSTG